MVIRSSALEQPVARSAPRWAGVLTVIRIFLAITFFTYGIVKVLGGQYNYGDWVIDKKTVDGTSLVWAFYGYSPFYGRFTGLFELGPAFMLLHPRTATIGAGALFAVALNVTAMDFAYHYPAVKWLALAYTIMLAILMWADRAKWALLLLDREQARAVARAAPSATPHPPEFSPLARRVLLVVAGLFVLAAANVVALSISNGPDVAARRAIANRVRPDEKIALVRMRSSGIIGLDWTMTTDFVVTGARATDTISVRTRRISVLPWRVTSVTSTRGAP